jgi:hypothetical protein
MTESTLSIVFANLPFLTSLVATAAPRISPHLSLSQWPRSRHASWVGCETPMRTTRFDSMASTIAAIEPAGALRKAPEHEMDTSKFVQECDVLAGEIARRDEDINLASPSLPRPVEMKSEARDSHVPKMRLSGGLAEMGALSLQDTKQGWPIYWS